MKDELRKVLDASHSLAKSHLGFLEIYDYTDGVQETRELIRDLESLLTRAEASPVDDAMLDRALDALRQGQYEGDQFRDSMRRALTAAMQQTEKK